MKTINIYTDGSCINNPGPGAYCAILEYGDRHKTITGLDENTTNNRMEIMAMLEAIKMLKEPCNVNVYSDSKYVVNTINDWIHKWVAKGHVKKKENSDLWAEYLMSSKGHNITAHWVARNSLRANAECDDIANRMANALHKKLLREQS